MGAGELSMKLDFAPVLVERERERKRAAPRERERERRCVEMCGGLCRSGLFNYMCIRRSLSACP